MCLITWRHHLQLIVNVDRFPEFIQEVGSEAVDTGFAVWSQASGLFSGNHALAIAYLQAVLVAQLNTALIVSCAAP